MGEPDDKKLIFFTNLLLLDFDPVAMERKWRLPFTKDMFQLPNKKGFETVMYFLFNRLNAARCREEFRDCWPVSDKKQEQQFRRVCNDWLSQIAKTDTEANLPRIVASVFMSPGGDRFLELLLYFSTYVLMKVAQAENGLKRKDLLQRPVLTQQALSAGIGNIMEKSVHCGIVSSRTRFLNHVQHTSAVQDQWRTFAIDRVKTYRGLTKAIRDKERHRKNEIDLAADKAGINGSPVGKRRKSGVADYDYDIKSVRRAQKVQKARDMWRTLEDYLSTRPLQEEIVESVLEGALEKYRIDAAELNVKVPDLLLRQCKQEIQRRGIDNIYQGGKLNLLSLIHLWNLSLHLYIDKFNHVGVPDFDNALPAVATQVHTHQTHLTNIEALRLKLEMEVLPELKDSISKLKARLDSEIYWSQSPNSIRTTISSLQAKTESLGLGLLPPTPPVSFEPADSKTPKDGQPCTTSNCNIPVDQASTPEAAAEIMYNISQKVRARQDMVVMGSPLYGPKAKTKPDRPQQQQNASKLPTRAEISVEKAGSKQRTNFSVSSKTMASSKQTDRKSTSVSSLNTLSTQQSKLAKQRMLSQTQKPPTLNKDENLQRSSTQKPRQTELNNKSDNHATHPRKGRRTPESERILADKIAEAVLAESPSDDIQKAHYFQDPIASLGREAFVSKDKVERSPHDNSRNTWHDSLLHDSIGPFSSTRVDQSAESTNKNHPNSAAADMCGEDNVFTVEAESNTKDVFTIHQYKSHLSKVRSGSPLTFPSSISSISPQSDRSSVQSNNNRQSTLINDISPDSDQNQTMEIVKDQPGLKSRNVQFLGVGQEVNREIPLFGEAKEAPLGTHKTFTLSPSQLDELADSMVDNALNLNNSSFTHGVDDSLLQLEAAHELYQSILQTKTPRLPTRAKSNRLDTVAKSVPASEDRHGYEAKNPVDEVKFAKSSVPEESEISDVEENVRVIKFANGSFSEYFDKSPIKLAEKGLKKSAINSERDCPSPLEVLKDVLDRTTRNLLSQCKEFEDKVIMPSRTVIRKPELPPGKFPTENDVIRGGAKPKKMPLISTTPAVSFADHESYLKTSPAAGKYGNNSESDLSKTFAVRKFCLDLSDEENETPNKKVNPANISLHRDEIHKRVVALSSPVQKNQPELPRTRSCKSLNNSLSRTPPQHTLACGILGQSFRLENSPSSARKSLRMSSHSDYHHPGSPSRHRAQTWDDIFSEDASCLLATSPVHESPKVGKLLDL